jgi:uncharacterized protein (DUF1330 family)
MVFGALLVLLALVIVAVVGQEVRYLKIRRDLVMDRQAPFHPATVFHVATMLKLAPGQDLLAGVRDFVESVEESGAEVVYAGKVLINARTSKQIPADDWDAFVLTQYASREAWDAARSSSDYQAFQSRFTNSYSLGMERVAPQNLAIPVFLLATRISQLIKGEPSRYPFTRAEMPADISPENRERMEAIASRLRAGAEYGKDSLVIVNFAKEGDAEQREANSGYGGEMLGLFAETGAGPMHMGRAVTVEGDADFDQVIIVHYPGVRFFAEMIQSEFYTGIFGGKQLSDDLSTLTVPLLPRL